MLPKFNLHDAVYKLITNLLYLLYMLMLNNCFCLRTYMKHNAIYKR